MKGEEEGEMIADELRDDDWEVGHESGSYGSVNSKVLSNSKEEVVGAGLGLRVKGLNMVLLKIW